MDKYVHRNKLSKKAVFSLKEGNNMQLTLQKCTKKEINTLRQISIETYYDTFASMNTVKTMQAYLETAFSKDKLEQELEEKDSLFLFLKKKEEIAGYLKLNEALAQTDIHDKVSVEIERIYVRRKFQGQGFGMYLMENVIQIALQRKSVIFG